MDKINGMRFTLSGELACFRKPDVNATVYFTYNNIHKIALLGMLGAILGLKGYRSKAVFGNSTAAFPEFYQRLQGMKTAIVPLADNGYFCKKIQYFNNSVGYASKEEGGILQVREQWLERPCWQIYLLPGSIEKSLWEKLCAYLQDGECEYIPYLGKNDFPATIASVEKCMLAVTQQQENCYIASLFCGTENNLCDIAYNDDPGYLFEEYAPVALRLEDGGYKLARAMYTNYMVTNISGVLGYDVNKLLYFL